ncbi:glycerol-3-phosphate dehydrogenase/oxidase [Nesterenkonia alkaliphila]|uniref:FAD-dependent oxidoreductase n=1 Tax=Nesterenkonia alkaliphila TaxID=1463631 RepID=A0A7K1ULQ5_9MICC|nr:glycerol-3-phosphate dehydrogenase/oxidase [Nesterenkonia alkaliphila]MVT27417.1 FAD-dependent oxidoreductase [Nesterenkonia alkaliphila]GFZ89964.1 glycerol-3-phosphate dehydrogenase [Nesterenkonia alkaliphila]
MKPKPLNAASRNEALARLKATADPEGEPLDVLVIGGGVVGAAAAFDAAGRGLRTGLVEARDFGEGTSSRSSKLVHGGLRYLQMLDFKLVAEALRERDLLLRRLAPHLVRPLPFIFPFDKPVLDRAFIGSGVTLYDTLASGSSFLRGARGRAVPFHRHLGRAGLRERFPALDAERYHGALEYYDAQVDDARLVLTLARSAHSLGAAVTSRTEAVEYLRAATPENSAAEPERITGVRLLDHLTGETFEAYAKEIILAAGVWTGQAQEAAATESGLKVLASKGIHITVPRERISAEGTVGIITQTEKSVLFLIPLRDVWAIGTTDTAWHGAVDSPAATSADIDYVLEHANAVLGEDLTREDVLATWAGLRPLVQPVATDESASTRVSREHTVMQLAPGLTGIAGGKLTTYRVMAEDVVNFAAEGSFKDRASITHALPLLGGQGYGEWVDQTEDLTARYGWDHDRVDRLLNRYGSLLAELLELIEQDPSLGSPLEQAPSYLRAEIAYAAQYEGAMHLDDLLSRRTRLVHETADRGLAALEEILQIAAPLLGWDTERAEAERSAYTSYVEAVRAAEQVQDDAAAAELIAASYPVPGQNVEAYPL